MQHGAAIRSSRGWWWELRKTGIARAASAALQFPLQDNQLNHAGTFRDLEAIERSRRSAGEAVDPKSTTEAGQIGCGSDVLGRHSRPVRRAERFVNKEPSVEKMIPQ